jgi:predicted transcriptional regulator
VEKVFKQHITKIIKILNSIENEGQLECAKNIISNFVEYWKFKKIDVKEIRNNLATFNMIYKFKRNSFYEQ